MVHADSSSIVLAKCEANAKWPRVRPPTTETKQHARPYAQSVTDEPFLNRVPLLEVLVDLNQPVPSPGGQVSGMASHQKCRTCRVGGVWRPLDLPQGATTRQSGGRAALCTHRSR